MTENHQSIAAQIRAMQRGECLEFRPGDRIAVQVAAHRAGLMITTRVTKERKLLVWRLE